MRAIIQRVTQASVTINDSTAGTFEGILPEPLKRHIGPGYVILLGVGHDDTEEDADKLWRKIENLRICADKDGKTNCSLGQVAGEVLVVSQFTLFANCRKGNRPSFTEAASPDMARHLYRYFVSKVQASLGHVAVGEFGANMEVALVNDGPFTISLDTDTL